jgi:hypothetical protein
MVHILRQYTVCFKYLLLKPQLVTGIAAHDISAGRVVFDEPHEKIGRIYLFIQKFFTIILKVF